MEKLLGEFSLGLFFWQTLLFVALLLLLKKFVTLLLTFKGILKVTLRHLLTFVQHLLRF